MDIIYQRRSIRKFTEKKISHNLLKELIQAGLSAPSARNQQPWEFVVIDQEEPKKEISTLHANFHHLEKAAAAIMVCGNLAYEKSPDYWVQDCSAATENILLAITAQQLGGVWIGVYPREERMNALQQFFNLPESVIPFSLIAVGYPAEEKEAHSQFDLKRVHWNRW